MSTSNDDALQKPENIKEQQCLHRNMLRRTRYAQMSPERKQLLLSQQQAKRAESKRQRLLQHSNNMISSSQVDSQEGDQNMLTISHPSVAFDTSGCISTFEIGSTSRRYDEAQKMSSPLITSNTCTSLSAKLILHLSSARNGIIIYHVQYLGPDTTPIPQVPPSGPGRVPGQVRSPVNIGPVAGRVRGDWRSPGMWGSSIFSSRNLLKNLKYEDSRRSEATVAIIEESYLAFSTADHFSSDATIYEKDQYDQ
uniref:Uncharacterized protein n=1 Tax=Solanum tuberosum TaxID=4113 RepID=M0ZL88_SOLTU